MIILTILFLLFSNSVTLRRDLYILFNRIAIIALIYSIFHNIMSLSILGKSISLQGGLFQVIEYNTNFYVFIFLISILILQLTSFYSHLNIIDYPLILLFVVSVAILISINDLVFVSIFILIELQNYGWYSLSAVYRNSKLSTTEGIRNHRVKILFNQTNKVRFTSTTRLSNSVMNSWFVTGFTDGEGCFLISFKPNIKLKTGWELNAKFQITLHQKDKALLELIKSFFSVGSIIKHGPESITYRVGSVKDLAVVFSHFDKYPLITQKLADYLIWKEVVVLMEKKEHLTLEGIQKIVNLKASLNKGLTDELKIAFPKTIPMQRPLVVDQVIKDPNWVAGFTSAEGCFIIYVYKSKTKIGEAAKLVFQLTQHARDEQLMRSLVEYFNCGNVNFYKEAVQLRVTKFEDLTDKVIPFFKKYPIHSVKYLDYLDWCLVAELIKNQKHLTYEGLDLIRKIKMGMNRGRNNRV